MEKRLNSSCHDAVTNKYNKGLEGQSSAAVLTNQSSRMHLDGVKYDLGSTFVTHNEIPKKVRNNGILYICLDDESPFARVGSQRY